jgi:hypothetical protein
MTPDTSPKGERAMDERELADLRAAALPRVGARYTWEPDSSRSREEVVVREVKWNGEEWWVLAGPVDGGDSYWNDLGRWIEATVFVAPAEDTP